MRKPVDLLRLGASRTIPQRSINLEWFIYSLGWAIDP